jgi:fibronectin type 3 domain-containing protein
LVAPELAVTKTPVNDQIELQWNAVPGATLYRIYKASEPYGEYSLFDSTNATSMLLDGTEAKAFFEIKADY